ncbi:MAG: TIGR00730 family Rossman fold protein [Pseudomonadota bacterium]
MTHTLSILVYCGSRPGADPAYMASATELGQAIAANNWRLVFGAGDHGIMGAVADATLTAGGTALGIIPNHLVPREGLKANLTEVVMTATMHERKALMFNNADVIALLPGGAGSLEEFFEMLTWAQIGLSKKPIYIVNTSNYWSKLIELIDHVIAEGFASDGIRGLFHVVGSPQGLVDAIKSNTN